MTWRAVSVRPSVEEWTLVNNEDEPHPFHIHVNHFQVVRFSSPGHAADAVWAAAAVGTWRDTVQIPRLVRRCRLTL
jgi:FtsP/CotA-like multicopper oxidase with cupredoxin domain